MKISAKTKICAIIGDPVAQSSSPSFHNALYERFGIDDQFAYIALRVAKENLKFAIDSMRIFGIRGMTVTIPHKIEAMHHLDEIGPVSQIIGAVNTIINDDGVLKGRNTDWWGILYPLERRTSLEGKSVALIGTGGAARAAAYAVIKGGARLTVFGRDDSKVSELATRYNCCGANLTQIEGIMDVDVIINATNIGMGEHTGETLIPKELLKSTHVVMDAVYAPRQTQLLIDAETKGASVISGIEMFLEQAFRQFRYFTNVEVPEETKREIIQEYSV